MSCSARAPERCSLEWGDSSDGGGSEEPRPVWKGGRGEGKKRERVVKPDLITRQWLLNAIAIKCQKQIIPIL